LVVNTPQVVEIANTTISNGISLNSQNRIVIANAGVYDMRVTLQITNADNAEAEVQAWLRFNGTDYPNSGHSMTIQPRKSSGQPNQGVLTFGFTGQSAAANDYIEIYWQSDNANTQLEYIAGSGIPDAGSVYVNIHNVAEVVTGADGTSGSSGISGTSGSSGTSGAGGSGGPTYLTYHAVDYNTPLSTTNIQEKFIQIPSAYFNVKELTGLEVSYGASDGGAPFDFNVFSEANYTATLIHSYQHPPQQQYTTALTTAANIGGSILYIELVGVEGEPPQGYTVTLVFEDIAGG